jgi:hypothetical protein
MIASKEIQQTNGHTHDVNRVHVPLMKVVFEDLGVVTFFLSHSGGQNNSSSRFAKRLIAQKRSDQIHLWGFQREQLASANVVSSVSKMDRHDNSVEHILSCPEMRSTVLHENWTRTCEIVHRL